jgi:Ca2+-binding RTX toxin-like protein
MTSTRVRAVTRLLLPLPVGLGLTALAAAPALAAGPTLVNSGGVARLSATAGMSMGLYTDAGQVVFSINSGDFASVAGCTERFAGDNGAYTCPGVRRIVINGSPAADFLTVDTVTVPMEVHGGGGDDSLSGGDGNDKIYGDAGEDWLNGYGGFDTIDGGAGDDPFVNGGAGNDTLTGGDGEDTVIGETGNDRVSGGDDDDQLYGDDKSGAYKDADGNDVLNGDAGADTLVPEGGRDVVNGGTGTDKASYLGYHDDGEIFRIALDGLGNDGEAGEGDNVGPNGDVENATAPDLVDFQSLTMTGNDGPNQLVAELDDGVVTIDGGAGNDEIRGSGSNGTTTLRGGDGDDRITGSSANETLLGGPGADTVFAGGGNDKVDGQTGADQVFGGSGNDNIQAVDNTADTISCGEDADIARVDTGDVVAVDVVSICESLTKVAPAKPNVVVPTTAEYQLDATGGATFSLTNNSRFPVTAAATASTTKVVGSGQATLAAQAGGTLRVQLNADGLATVERRGSMRASVTFVLTGNGQTTTVKRVVTFLKH